LTHSTTAADPNELIVTPNLYERERLIVTRRKFILAEDPLQN
jgi:hypothetical protein